MISHFHHILVAAAMSGLIAPALAHNAPTGWDYDPDCCNTMDCAEVPDGTVHEVAGGYQVTLTPEQHHNLSVPLNVVVSHTDKLGNNPRIRPSGDGKYHVCVAHNGHIFCLYVPHGGV